MGSSPWGVFNKRESRGCEIINPTPDRNQTNCVLLLLPFFVKVKEGACKIKLAPPAYFPKRLESSHCTASCCIGHRSSFVRMRDQNRKSLPISFQPSTKQENVRRSLCGYLQNVGQCFCFIYGYRNVIIEQKVQAFQPGL